MYRNTQAYTMLAFCQHCSKPFVYLTKHIGFKNICGGLPALRQLLELHTYYYVLEEALLSNCNVVITQGMIKKQPK